MSKSLSKRTSPSHPKCRLPRLRTRERRCYELAYRGAMRAHDRGEEWVIVHGTWTEYAIGHAWLARGEQVFCPTTDRIYSEADYLASHHAEPRITYTVSEAAGMVRRSRHYGPWVDLYSPLVSLSRHEAIE